MIATESKKLQEIYLKHVKGNFQSERYAVSGKCSKGDSDAEFFISSSIILIQNLLSPD